MESRLEVLVFDVGYAVCVVVVTAWEKIFVADVTKVTTQNISIKVHI